MADITAAPISRSEVTMGLRHTHMPRHGLQTPIKLIPTNSGGDSNEHAGVKLYYDTDESREGVAALKEKRPPDFKKYAK